MNPRFLDLEEALAIHADLIKAYGGSDGLRDMGLLQAALAAPQAGIAGQYLHEDIPAMAAAYLYHLACNHPFVDGNKRVAAAAANVFLLLNGHRNTASSRAYEGVVLRVASSEMHKAELTVWFRKHIRPSD